MRAIRFHQYGGPEVLRHEDVDVPNPSRGQVRVRVAGTSFNGVENNIRAGRMQGPMPMALPHTPGVDVAGVVDALGPGVEGPAVGDAVVAFLPFATDGAAADHVLVEAASLAPAPTSVPLAEAAVLPTVGLTAYQALFVHADLRRGQRVLVNGAGGAVGAYAVQLARAAGAHVVATAGPTGRDRVRALGADEVVDHTTTDLLTAVGNPVDVLLNLAPVDPATYASLVALVADDGVVVGTTVWMPAPSDEPRGVRGVDMYVESDAAQLAELTARVDRDELRLFVTERVALEDLPDVHARAEAGTLSGKVLVVVAQD
ncbi:NADP-dependent oxidoreductase [Nocardioides sp. CFH 31398]|uniref:NADP-dependent oxidoreductase n=1 Tax=Nocardioides sp. CFH 31398 TaxID=2919579 RepID=UPI001F050A6B|nr:NADP-dependent oxidoreductase [Nocardioides sp. CFH 31398]MCH1865752.1 NADP-dependent oxidoreductase [Nocardioides sp. CFH 31398]